MIIETIEQGTEAWKDIRRGVPTASCFDKIMTATRLERSSSLETYLHQLAAESIGIFEDDWKGNSHSERGNEFESDSVFWYEVTNDVSTEQVGFVWKDDQKLVGCSPDSLVGTDGGLETKNPKATTHIKWLRAGAKIPAEHLAQVYGNLWVTGRSWWDFLSYRPEFSKQLEVRVAVDDEPYKKWLRAWEPEIESFCQRLAVVKGMVREWKGSNG